jgi:hypothetical protein
LYHAEQAISDTWRKLSQKTKKILQATIEGLGTGVKLASTGVGTLDFKVFVKRDAYTTSVFSFAKASKIDFSILIRQEQST